MILSANVVEIPRMNHDFVQYPDASRAFPDSAGKVDPDPAAKVMQGWLKRIFAA